MVSILTGPLRPVLRAETGERGRSDTGFNPHRPVKAGASGGAQPGVLVGVFSSFARTGGGLAKIRLAACLPQRENRYFSI